MKFGEGGSVRNWKGGVEGGISKLRCIHNKIVKGKTILCFKSLTATQKDK